MSLPDCSRQMDLNYKYYFPELFLRAFRCGRSAARTSGMGPGPCLRGTLGGGVNSSALRCHLGALQNEGQSTSRVFGFNQLLEKIHRGHSCTSWGCQLNTPSLRTLLWGRTQLGKWSQLWAVHGAGGLEGWRAQREGVHNPQPPARWQQRIFRVKHVAILRSSFRWLS